MYSEEYWMGRSVSLMRLATWGVSYRQAKRLKKKAAEALKGDYIFSGKPNPADLATETFQPDLIRRRIEECLSAAKGCVLEIIIKDTHTVRSEPHRLSEWVRIARQVGGAGQGHDVTGACHIYGIPGLLLDAFRRFDTHPDVTPDFPRLILYGKMQSALIREAAYERRQR